MDLNRDRLETRELVYFLTVAEELHFGRAAECLGIAQPPLSRAIARLERRVGVPLFARTSRSVALTAAGQALLVGARATLEALDQAVRRTQLAGASRLRLAATPGAGTVPLRALITAYGRTKDPAAIEMVFTRDPAAAARVGQADLALACDTEDLSGLQTLDIATERPVALLPAQHPLAASRSLSLSRLRAEATFAEQCPALSLDEIIDSVALDRLIVIVGEGAAARTGPAVTGVPVAGLAPSTLVLAWAGEVLPATSDFLAAARRYVTRTSTHALASVAAS
jgi:DNA-binding transcriptional LysR family regulator